MISKGIVRLVNLHTGFFAIETADGDYPVSEMTDTCEVAAGDEVSGNLDSPMSETLQNITQGYSMSVYVQGTHCAAATARAMVFR